MTTLEQQKRLLQIEYAAEKEAYRKQTEAQGIARKVKRGDAWYPVTVGRAYYNSINQKVVEIYRNDDDRVEHNFEYGRPVVFFHINNKLDGSQPRSETTIHYADFVAVVSYADDERMVVSVPDTLDVLSVLAGTNVGVQLYFDEYTYQLMFDALDRVMNAEGNRLAYLRDLFNSKQAAQHFAFDTTTLPWLNPTQQKAVNEVLRAKDVAVVHGPPGTGKTTTLVEAINETLKRESQVLVSAQSNMAVDWIAEKLIDRGISVLRIGNPRRVTDRMLSFTYERQFEAHPDYPTLWKIRQNIRELHAKHRKSRIADFHQKLSRLQSRATELELRINSTLFNNARAIVCTLTGCANRLLEGQTFNTIFIDEAAQALEAACWIGIRRARRVVLAGDHCQLPPTIKSYEAMRGGLATTLMERIVKNKPDVVTLLTTQYRMNDAIMRFSSNVFYNGMVESAPQVRDRGILDLDDPMTWIDDPASAEEQFVGATFGRVNREEAALVVATLEAYLEKIGRERYDDEHIDVGIISPYRAQVALLRHLIKQSAKLKPFRYSISVNTVDGFQGQERDIIMLSLVRNNDKAEIGFLRDLRRMNVAITRARMKLIIVGDVATMTRHPFYKKLYEYINNIQQNGSAN